MNTRRAAAVVVIVLAGAGLALAQPAGLAYAPPEAPPPVSAGALLLRLFGMTVFVLLLCAGLLWVARAAQRPRLSGPAAPEKLRLLESVALNGRCTVHLLQAGSCRVVAAVDPSGLRACQVVGDSFADAIAGVGAAADAGGPSTELLLAALAASGPAATYGPRSATG